MRLSQITSAPVQDYLFPNNPFLSSISNRFTLFGLGWNKNFLMRITGLEPARLLTIEPKSIASANSAISAFYTDSAIHFSTVRTFLIIAFSIQKVKTRHFTKCRRYENIFVFFPKSCYNKTEEKFRRLCIWITMKCIHLT